jgi:hypothetical protein
LYIGATAKLYPTGALFTRFDGRGDRLEFSLRSMANIVAGITNGDWSAQAHLGWMASVPASDALVTHAPMIGVSIGAGADLFWPNNSR